MKIAVEGCAHGELEKIYDTIQNIEKNKGISVDLLLCCGDFESTRNLEDLQTMAVPKKYQNIGTFYKYYSGEKLAPILTIFIGGNHEASNYLQELPYGGWVAPNIYYLGYAGVVRVNGLRIGGMSGIYKHHDFYRGHHEFPPYNESTMRSVYHQRHLEVFRLNQLSGNIDVLLSHDWPNTVANYGNAQQLCKFKPHFREQIESNRLGSPACERILFALQPTYWFAAHLHCKFSALIPHDDGNKTTKFLALDKCLPQRRFLQILDIDDPQNVYGEKILFEYDLEWLTILSITNHLLSVKESRGYMPGPGGPDRFEFTPTDDEKDCVKKKFSNDLEIPKNFCLTVETYNPSAAAKTSDPHQPNAFINPQTTKFCDTLGIDDPLSLAMVLNGHELSHSSTLNSSNGHNEESFSIVDSEDQATFNCSGQNSILKRTPLGSALPKPKWSNLDESNPEELIIGSDDEDDEMELRKECSKQNFLNDKTEEDLSFQLEDDLNQYSTAATVAAAKDETTVSAEESVHIPENKDDDIPKSIKQFKRRNQSIYGNNDDDNIV